MKFSTLKQIVTHVAYKLKESAEYNGSWSDGGCESLLSKLEDYQQRFVVKLDLRPSELNKLNDIEVGEPHEFSDIIERYKINISKSIKL